MLKSLNHELAAPATKDERSRQEFVAALRGHVLGNMADHMRDRYYSEYADDVAAENGNDVHDAMLNDAYFRFYSSVRYNAQEMVFRSVTPSIERNLPELNNKAADLRAEANNLQLDDSVEVPRSVSAIDVHLAPGSYHSEFADNDVATGAIYDHSINVFAYNQMGENMDDIGTTMSNYVRLNNPDFKPTRILDAGCTIGHNTLPWKQTFPEAEVTGIDVCAPLIRYGAARASSMGIDVRFAQMDVTSLTYPDNHFDVVFSSMLLHELPLKDIRAYIKEAFRVLKPGGLFLTMELAPNTKLSAYDQFNLDWDCYYNNEPFYKAFRDQDYAELCATAGFDTAGFFDFQAPRYTYMPEENFIAAMNAEPRFDEHSGTVTEGLRWYGFGCWKQA